jgi:hypothetical protein
MRLLVSRRMLLASAWAALSGLTCVGIGTPIALHEVAARPAHLGTKSPQPPVVPASGAYLGIDPNFNVNAPFAVQTMAFEKKLGTRIGLVGLFLNFGQVPPIGSIDELEDQGALPLISMNCGPSDASVAAGLHDRQLEVVARALKAYGRPVLFRWFWEMNLPSANGHAACLGPTNQGPNYIAAFQHVWTVFHQVGATNVSFVWCPSVSASAAHKTDLYFYPGGDYVGWIGADVYDRPQVTATFAQQFGPFYQYWLKHAPNKPFILSETGAVGSTAQVSWLHEIQSALTVKLPGSSATPFTQVHAVCYVDAVALANYILKQGTPGFNQFGHMAREKFFSVYVSS